MSQPHPLRTLSPAELEHASQQAHAWAGTKLLFFEIDLHEAASTSDKEAALLHGDWSAFARRARVVCADPARQRVYVGDVAVAAGGAPPNLHHVPRVQPPMVGEEYELVEATVMAHAPFRAACAARGIDPAHVRVDAWCAGWYSADDDAKRRLAIPMLYVQEVPGDNLYARPLEGIEMKIDLWAAPKPAVVLFRDFGRTPLPPRDPLMAFPRLEGSRPPLPPLSAVQPSGAGFSLGDDGALAWQRWTCTIGFSAREGAVLHALQYDGRPVAWRLSWVEMVVPYADPNHPHCFKNAFDLGEDGLGRNCHELDPDRCDCLPGAAAAFLDACIATADGGAAVRRRVVCVHEEDGGLLYKHLDWRDGASVARRNRKLVVMFVATVANYTYGFAYKLGLDGTIEFEATLTGILSLGSLGNDERAAGRPYGQTLSADGLYGPDHQHFFVARLDMAVDGLRNRVVEVEAAGAPDDGDHRGAFRRTREVLRTEKGAARRGRPEAGRHWVVESDAAATNRVGERTAWKLEPGGGSALRPLAAADATFMRRAPFLDRNLWVTRYRPGERYPAGDFPNQSAGGDDGLAAWVERRDGALDDADVVLWHVLGVTHAVRPEDYPVMPCERVGFALKPSGFFDASPCVDVPCDACGRRSRL